MLITCLGVNEVIYQADFQVEGSSRNLETVFLRGNLLKCTLAIQEISISKNYYKELLYLKTYSLVPKS